jgi:hypothetical protein
LPCMCRPVGGWRSVGCFRTSRICVARTGACARRSLERCLERALERPFWPCIPARNSAYGRHPERDRRPKHRVGGKCNRVARSCRLALDDCVYGLRCARVQVRSPDRPTRGDRPDTADTALSDDVGVTAQIAMCCDESPLRVAQRTFCGPLVDNRRWKRDSSSRHLRGRNMFSFLLLTHV